MIIPTVYMIILMLLIGVWLFFVIQTISRIVRERYVISLLYKNEIDTFLDEIEKDIQKLKPKSVYRQCLMVNKSAGLSYKGYFDQAIYSLNAVNFDKLPGIVKILYVNNYLFTLVMSNHYNDAKRFYEKHKTLLKKKPRNKHLAYNLTGTLAAYTYCTHKSDTCEHTFQKLLSQSLTDIHRAVVTYFLGLIYRDSGNTELAQLYFKKTVEKGSNSCFAFYAQKEILSN